MNQFTHSRPRILSLVLVTIAILVAHWMALFNEGLVSEDSGLFPALLYKDWHAIMDMYSSAAVPVFTYYVWPMAFVVNIFLFKAILILAVYLTAVLAYLIGLRSGYLSDREALLVAVFSQLLPIAMVTTIFTYSTYFSAYALFLLASYFFVCMETTRGLRHFTLRAFSLCLYFFAFTLNSLLVLFAGAFLLAYMVRLRVAGLCVRSFRDAISAFGGFCKSRIDFALLPIIYWMHKKVYTPRSGLYSGYNSFDFVPSHLAKNIYHFIVDGFVLPVAKSFGVMNSYIFLAVVLYSIFFIWLFLKFSSEKNHFSSKKTDDERGGWALIGFGFFLLLCGTVPYVLVGKSPMPGVLMRNAILMPLPLSVMLVGAWRVLKFRSVAIANASTTILFVLLVLFTGRWWDNYASWQARAAKDMAVATQLAKNPQWSNFSVYWIEDKFLLQGSASEYGFSDYTAQFRMLWGGQTRMAFTPAHTEFLGVDSKPGVRPVHSKFPDRISYFCNDWSSAKDINLGGPQAALEITSGLTTWTNESIAFEFLYFRFIKPQGLQKYLSTLVTVKLRPL